MDQNSVNEIVRSTGCDPKLAGMLFEFTGGDPEGVRKILDAVDKDVLIFKVRYTAQTAKKYGVMLIYTNQKTRKLEKLTSLVSAYEEGSYFQLKKDWQTLEKDIEEYRDENYEDHPEISKVRERIDTKLAQKIAKNDVKYLQELLRQSNMRQLNQYFANEIYDITGDPNVKCEVHIEQIDVFTYCKGNPESISSGSVSSASGEESALPDAPSANDSEELEGGAADTPTGGDTSAGDPPSATITYKTDLVLSPMKGKVASDLKHGDVVFLRIIESDESAEYLAKLLDGKLEGNQVRLSASIMEINTSGTGNLEVVTELGPNIVGKALVTPNTKVEVSKMANPSGSQQEKEKLAEDGREENGQEKQASSNALFYWIIIFIIIIMVLMGVLSIFRD